MLQLGYPKVSQMQNPDEKYNFEYNLLSPYFDRRGYIERYGKDEQFDHNDPLAHYLLVGAKKGFSPSEFFDGNSYLESNNDIAKAGLNPLVHYLRFGFDEGRAPRSNQSVLDRINIDLGNPDLNFKKWRLPCILDDQVVASANDIQEIITQINQTQANATILDRRSDDWLIVFSGRDEHFYYLNKIYPFWGNILFLRDTSATYYCDHPNLPKPNAMSSYIDYLTGPRVGKTILLGQSAGGHAALYQSSCIEDCLAFSFSPQAYHPELYTYDIYFEGTIKKLAPPHCTPDIVAHLKSVPDAPRYVIVAKSESTHQDTYYWGDAVSAGIIASTGKCSVIVVNRREHPTFQYLDARKFFDLLHDNYDIFINDRRRAAGLFCESNLYYPTV